MDDSPRQILATTEWLNNIFNFDEMWPSCSTAMSPKEADKLLSKKKDKLLDDTWDLDETENTRSDVKQTIKREYTV